MGRTTGRIDPRAPWARNGPADEPNECQIRDRPSCMDFLGLDLRGRCGRPNDLAVPGAFERSQGIETRLARFDAHPRACRYLAMGGQMIDTAIVEARWQRAADTGKDDLETGRADEAWPPKPVKPRQEDRDGRRALKRSRRKRRADGTLALAIATPNWRREPLGSDRRHRLIRAGCMTDAARYEGRKLPGLPDEASTGPAVRADTADGRAKQERRLARAGLPSGIQFRKSRGRPMSEPRPRQCRPLQRARRRRTGRRRPAASQAVPFEPEPRPA